MLQGKMNCNLKLKFHSILTSAYDTRGNMCKLIPIYCKSYLQYIGINMHILPVVS